MPPTAAPTQPLDVPRDLGSDRSIAELMERMGDLQDDMRTEVLWLHAWDKQVALRPLTPIRQRWLERDRIYNAQARVHNRRAVKALLAQGPEAAQRRTCLAERQAHLHQLQALLQQAKELRRQASALPEIAHLEEHIRQLKDLNAADATVLSRWGGKKEQTWTGRYLAQLHDPDVERRRKRLAKREAHLRQLQERLQQLLLQTLEQLRQASAPRSSGTMGKVVAAAALLVLHLACGGFVSSAAAADAVLPPPKVIRIELATPEERAKREIGPWVRDLLAAPREESPVLVLWYGCGPVPMPTERSRYVLGDFQRFQQRATLRNTRNALALLGPPDTCRENPAGFVATWGHALEDTDGTPVQATLEIAEDGHTETWSYRRIDNGAPAGPGIR